MAMLLQAYLVTSAELSDVVPAKRVKPDRWTRVKLGMGQLRLNINSCGLQ